MNRAPTVTLRLPRLYPKQREAIFTEKRYAVIEASTKSGKTVGCLAWMLSIAWETGMRGRNYWWVAPVYPQADIAFRRMKSMLHRMQKQIKSRLFVPNETKLYIELMNGARIWFKSAEKPDNLFGEDVYGAVFDEAARARPEAWYALRSTLTATRAPVRLISNVKGRKNWLWRLARKAEAGEPDHSYAKITCHDAIEGGVLAEAEIEDARRTLPEHVFRELYLAEASDDEGNPFGLAAIAAITQPAEWIGDGPPCAWGFDFAKSVDWTVGIALNEGGEVCGYQRWQSDWLNTMKRTAAMIAGTPAFVDSTGVGDPIAEQLQRACGCVTGYNFTGRKQQLMEGLATAIQQREIAVPDGPIISELWCYEYEYTRTGVRYTAPEGMHDDCVCALALAVACHREKIGGRLEVRLMGSDVDDWDEERYWQ